MSSPDSTPRSDASSDADSDDDSLRKAPLNKPLRKRLSDPMIVRDSRGIRDKLFFPEGELADVLSDAAVENELKKCLTPSYRDASAVLRFAIKSAPRIFSALVFGGGGRFIVPLHLAGFKDKQLPANDEDLRKAIRKGLRRLKDSRKDLYEDMKYDTDAAVHNFVDSNQWLFTAPVFGGAEFEHKLPAKTRLPFLPIDPSETTEAAGGFGKVQERVIHRNHIVMDGLETPYRNVNGQLHPRVAEKELTKPDRWDTKKHEKEAEKEAKNLRDIRKLNHPHLIKAIAYYVQDGRHVFLFPFAENGNLRQHWAKADPGLEVSSHQLEWSLEQLAGVTDAVRLLHKDNVNCRHGDLKPENILCFRRGNSDNRAVYRDWFVIADVGLAKSHNDITAARDGKTTTMGRTMMYSPPELEFDEETPRSRLFDIWSLGCVFLEHIVWLAYGKTGLENFQNEMGGFGQRGPFYAVNSETRSGDGPEAQFQVHPAVERWAEHLKKRPCCGKNTALRKLVDVITDKMLVIATPNHGAANPEELGRKATRRLVMPQGQTAPQVLISPPTIIDSEQESTSTNLRANASEIHAAVEDILKGLKSGALRLTANSSAQGPIPASLLSAPGPLPRSGGLTSNRNALDFRRSEMLIRRYIVYRQWEGLQLGFPRLPEAGSSSHTNVISRWLADCDKNHGCFPHDIGFLPTRLIDVGTERSAAVRLVCDTASLEGDTQYIALSHRWGREKTLKTRRKNVEGLKEWIINLELLPRTFRHAVQVTRSLGMSYLWIDSLCIIQDDAEDWDQESQRMEEVFSSAYCTIAATCASGTNDGFLKERSQRQVVAMKDARSGVPFYVCEAINDFGGDVDESELNSRGWVLQERALARRTVHFTKNQTYWECGKGVRCETLTKMTNNFPEYAVLQSKGKKIKLLQSLYEKYSKMNLSFAKDRPIAIKGLETRLIQTVGGQGGYGVFQGSLHRYLLWQRGKQPLERIQEFSGGPVPSWSWMAWKGGIEYMPDIPGGAVTWNPDVSWSSPPTRTGNDHENSKSLYLSVRIRDFSSDSCDGITMDEGGAQIPPGAKCVVLGVTKDQASCYVLVVTKFEDAGYDESSQIWERIGVGKVRGMGVDWEKPSPVGTIR
ncbi:hypothetical protein B0T16DRAFT_386632 [Cercophora newfieldiana]|uniref:Protein kinase domain-containing protein n=1 Tax=Cercophora newfieldiana TaxID=92897 RepID=A0AA39YFX9_9PEZI|nr:hypothetical protein B0T16DRAFT_386632 [Cercophora newfieldiana]